jgi:Leucine-rich repeat (LRR) protein
MAKRKQENSKKNKAGAQGVSKKEFVKPPQVIDIEEAYGIEMTHDPDFNAQAYVAKAAYSLDEEGNITGLSAYDSTIDDIRAISKLASLKYLNLTRANLQNLEGIEALSELESLYLGDNNISDISPLAACKKLKQLAIWDNPIENAYILCDLHELETLYMQTVDCSRVTIGLLSQKLKELALDGCGITDISSITRLKEVGYVSMSDNFIEDISCCTQLNGLTHLDVRNNLVSYIPKEFASHFKCLALL